MTKARQMIVSRMVEAGAVSPECAVPLGAEDRETAWMLRRLCRHGALTETKPGHYWLDADRMGSFGGTMRRRLATWVGTSGIAVVATAAITLVE